MSWTSWPWGRHWLIYWIQHTASLTEGRFFFLVCHFLKKKNICQCFEITLSLCKVGWSQTFGNPPTSASCVLGLQACNITPGFQSVLTYSRGDNFSLIFQKDISESTEVWGDGHIKARLLVAMFWTTRKSTCHQYWLAESRLDIP